MRDNWAGADRVVGMGDPSDPEVIRADIQRTRERMSRTVEDLGERLNPDRLKGQLKQNIHDATIGKAENMARNAVGRVDETRHSIMDNIRDNPLPAAMVGIGLGWLFLNGKREEAAVARRDRAYADMELGYSGNAIDRTVILDRSGDAMDSRMDAGSRSTASRLGHSASEMGNDLRHRTEELTHMAQDRVTEIAQEGRDQARHLIDRAHSTLESGSTRARTMASGLMDETRRDVHRVEDRFEDALRETPLAIGAAAVAIGMAIGLTAPATRRESELMGARRDELLERARESAGEVTQRMRDVADRVVNEAQSTVREAVQQTGMT